MLGYYEVVCLVLWRNGEHVVKFVLIAEAGSQVAPQMRAVRQRRMQTAGAVTLSVQYSWLPLQCTGPPTHFALLTCRMSLRRQPEERMALIFTCNKCSEYCTNHASVRQV